MHRVNGIIRSDHFKEKSAKTTGHNGHSFTKAACYNMTYVRTTFVSEWTILPLIVQAIDGFKYPRNPLVAFLS
jgi:hypothetical protein